MDEYLFIVLAKLKADRLKLEREQAELRWLSPPHEENPISSHRHSPRTRWFVSDTEWREQS